MRALPFVAVLLLAACAESTQGVRASLEGSYDGSVVDMRGASDDGDAAPRSGALLAAVPSRAFLRGETPEGHDYVALVRGELVTERDWDRPRCGAVPAGGVCAKVTLRNMYATRRLSQVFVELTQLVPRAPSPPTTHVAFRSDAAADPGLGTSDAIGLTGYPSLGPAGARDDHAERYWVFESATPGPLLFHFRAVVKATLTPATP